MPKHEPAPALSLAEIALTHQQHRTAVNPHRLKVHAKALGVGVDALNALAIGWDGHRQAWTFPMRNASRQIVGLRYRRDDGAKWSLKGGSEGVFWPAAIDGGPVVVCEGPTSAAAWLTLGVNVLGRSSCTGGGAVLAKVLATAGRPVLIVADRDNRKTRRDGSHFYPGQDGALALYEQLRHVCDCAWAVCPVSKDVRDWLKRGDAHEGIVAWVRNQLNNRSPGGNTGGDKHDPRSTLTSARAVRRSA